MKAAKTVQKNQQKQTLSAKKQKHKFKNASKSVLAENSLGFKGIQLTVELCLQFKENMFSYFKYEPVPVLEWSELKKYSKEERKALKPKSCIPSRNCLALGFNEVTRALEQKTATIVIISDNIKPDLICKHIFQHCDVHNIPLLKIWNFKTLSKECFGFTSMMMAFKEVENTAKVYTFYRSVLDLYSTACSKPSTSKFNLFTKQIKNKTGAVTTVIEEPKKILQKEPEKKVEEDYRTDVYVYKNNSNSRTFIPQPKKEKSQILNTDFIAFGNSTPTIITDSKTQLKNLVVKKIKGNRNKKRKNRRD